MPTIDELLESYSTTYLSLPIVTDWSDGFPVREITVDKAEAFTLAEALRDSFAETKVWPLIVDGLPEYESASSIREALEVEKDLQDGQAAILVGQSAIDGSVGVDPLSLLPLWVEDVEDVDGPAVGELMRTPHVIQANPGGINMVGGDLSAGIAGGLVSSGRVLLVPCDAPWESVVRVGFGGWNQCPPPTEQATFLRTFAEGAGAEPLAINHSSLWLAMTRRVDDNAEAVRLARVMVRYCYELIDRGHEELAAALLGGPSSWALWWD